MPNDEWRVASATIRGDWVTEKPGHREKGERLVSKRGLPHSHKPAEEQAGKNKPLTLALILSNDS